MDAGCVRAIIVHHERPDAAAGTVRSFLADDVVGRVVVVDSGSTTAALANLRDQLAGIAQVEILAAGTNVGFGPGANIGLRAWLADGDAEPWALVAPHDARPRSGCVRRVVAELGAQPRGAMACAEYGPGEEFRPTIDRFFGGSFVSTTRGDGWESVDYAHGTLLAFRPDALREIGLFDERFFAYCEEADIGIRARAAGWEVGLVWGAVVDNGRPPRADVGRYLQLRNTLLLLEKHFGLAAVGARLVWEIGVLVSGGVGPTLGVGVDSGAGSARSAIRRSSFAAICDYVTRRFGAPPPSIVGQPAGEPADV